MSKRLSARKHILYIIQYMYLGIRGLFDRFYFFFPYLIQVLGPSARLINVGTLMQLYRLERARRRFANHRSITTRINNNELPAQKSVSIYRIVNVYIHTLYRVIHYSPTKARLIPSYDYNAVSWPGFICKRYC